MGLCEPLFAARFPIAIGTASAAGFLPFLHLFVEIFPLMVCVFASRFSRRGNLLVRWGYYQPFISSYRSIQKRERVFASRFSRRGNLSVRRGSYHSFTSSYRSFHSGLIELINSSFFFLEPAFICFSLAMASPIKGKPS